MYISECRPRAAQAIAVATPCCPAPVSAIILFFPIFFFSRRRRHTMSYGDWSSDVCSSDLDAEQILGFAPAFVVHALGGADAAEVGAQRHVAELEEGSRESLHDLVVERPAVERVRMGDERRAARCTCRTLDDGLDPARRTVDEDALARPAHMRRRATTRPALRCSSMISSISARST